MSMNLFYASCIAVVGSLKQTGSVELSANRLSKGKFGIGTGDRIFGKICT